MASFNKVVLLGNLTRDPELKFIPSGQAVCNMGLATNRKWKNQQGEWKDEPTFINVVVWGKSAEACGEYLKKGSQVLIEGRLQSRSWEDNEGKKRSVLEVVSERCQFLGGKPNQGDGGTSEGMPSGQSEDEVPF